jgi:hypothetical protein
MGQAQKIAGIGSPGSGAAPGAPAAVTITGISATLLPADGNGNYFYGLAAQYTVPADGREPASLDGTNSRTCPALARSSRLMVRRI